MYCLALASYQIKCVCHIEWELLSVHPDLNRFRLARIPEH